MGKVIKTIKVNPWGAVIPGNLSQSAIEFTQEFELLEYLIFYVLASGRVLSTRYDEFREDSVAFISSLGPSFKETFDQVIASTPLFKFVPLHESENIKELV